MGNRLFKDSVQENDLAADNAVLLRPETLDKEPEETLRDGVHECGYLNNIQRACV